MRLWSSALIMVIGVGVLIAVIASSVPMKEANLCVKRGGTPALVATGFACFIEDKTNPIRRFLICNQWRN